MWTACLETKRDNGIQHTVVLDERGKPIACKDYRASDYLRSRAISCLGEAFRDRVIIRQVTFGWKIMPVAFTDRNGTRYEIRERTSQDGFSVLAWCIVELRVGQSPRELGEFREYWCAQLFIEALQGYCKDWTMKLKYEDAPEYNADAYSVLGYKGIAFCVLGWEVKSTEDEGDRTGNLVMVMIGDDRHHSIDPDDISPLNDEDYCSTCGQIGCGC